MLPGEAISPRLSGVSGGSGDVGFCVARASEMISIFSSFWQEGEVTFRRDARENVFRC